MKNENLKSSLFKTLSRLVKYQITLLLQRLDLTREYFYALVLAFMATKSIWIIDSLTISSMFLDYRGFLFFFN